MRTLSITEKPSPSKSLPLKFSFTSQGVAVTPVTIAWSLTDGKGTTVNSRTDVAVAVPAATIYIALAPADLAVADGYERVMTLEWTYDSDVYGSGVADGLQIKFSIERWV